METILMKQATNFSDDTNGFHSFTINYLNMFFPGLLFIYQDFGKFSK